MPRQRSAGALFGWARAMLAIASGAAAAFAQPPWNFLPGLLGYATLLRLLDAAPPRRSRPAFALGWLGGVGYFLVSLIWIANPFFVQAKTQGWMAPIAPPLVTAVMALFWGVAALVYRRFARPGPLRLFLFAGVFAAAEWLRGHLLTGFPWDLPGETWSAGTPISQAASWAGAYGLTWITLLGAAAFALALEPGRARLLALMGPAMALALWGSGALRLAHAARPGPAGVPIRIVQADIPEALKYDPAWFDRIVERYVALTALPAAATPRIVIWSEGAIPAPLADYLAPGTWTEAAIAGALRPGQSLIVGGYRFGVDKRGRPAAFNSLAIVERRAAGLAIVADYDKHRLVPFGEFMPLPGLARRLGLEQLVHVGDGFTAGPPPRPLRVAGIPAVQPLICYESLFPGYIHSGEREAGFRPRWIVNISNDSWFGRASGPAQHLNLASYRAIEEGLPMVRATPTGVSAVIDAYGRILPGKRLGEGALGVIDAPLPAPLAPTFYARWGSAPFVVMLLVSLIGAGRPTRE